MSVYTRAGDTGKTRLYQGKVISKGSLRIDAIGSIDELNSLLGIVLSEIKGSKLKVQRLELIKIQNDLFEIGGALANPSSKVQKLNKRVEDFEKIIDKLEKSLPPLNNFILPGGGRAGSLLHLARTVERRVERAIVRLFEEEGVPAEGEARQGRQDEIIIYMNRLSDLLFMLARFINFKEKKKELVWKSR